MFKVATWNIACLPTIINPLRRPGPYVVNNIINLIKKHNFDIVCFQEVFCYEVQTKICDSLKNLNYNIHISKPEGFISKNGLLTASKLPIIQTYEVDYTNFIGPEYIIKKGMISSIIDGSKVLNKIKNTILDNNIIIHNSHLQSDSLGPIVKICKEVRSKQHKDIYDHLKKICYEYNIEDYCLDKNKPKTLQLVCGDINDDFEDKQLKQFIKNLPFEWKNINKEKIITFNSTKQQLDFIISNQPNLNINYNIIDMVYYNKLSDHNLFFANIYADDD